MEARGASSSDSSSKASPSANGTTTVAALPPPFLSKTYDMVDDPASDTIVSWGAFNNSFVVWNPPEFARDLLPKYFKHNHFSSFVRQLNTYGFRKVDPDKWEFVNEGFLRGQKHLLKTISRRKPTHVQQTQSTPPPPQKAPVSACVEVGKFGLEEEIEQLKRDKNILMQELVRLRQQQQTSDHQLNTLNERLHGMEQRQQQMMSFLAKAMQSPGFLAQLVQQTDTNRRLTVGNKKRRFPKKEQEVNGESSSSSSSSAAPDGQIIKYQPLINEAAKSMVLQMLNLDIPSDNFLFDNFSNQLEKNNVNLPRNSGVTLKEVVPANTEMSYLPSTSTDIMDVFDESLSQDFNQTQGVPQDFTLMQCTPLDFTKELTQTQSAAQDFTQTQSVAQNFTQQQSVTQNLTQQQSVAKDFTQNQEIAPDGEHLNAGTVPSILDDTLLDIDAITTDNFDYLDDIENLPSIGDPFWENLLRSPVDANADDTQESDDMITGESGLDNSQNMENLTEQMGHLSSEIKKV